MAELSIVIDWVKYSDGTEYNGPMTEDAGSPGYITTDVLGDGTGSWNYVVDIPDTISLPQDSDGAAITSFSYHYSIDIYYYDVQSSSWVYANGTHTAGTIRE